MTKLANYLEKVDLVDQQFMGAITFRSEELTLPDGSKMALGIDDGHWVLIYQRSARGPFQVFQFDQHEKKILIDHKPGGKAEIGVFKKHLAYFFKHASVEDLVTLLPPKG